MKSISIDKEYPGPPNLLFDPDPNVRMKCPICLSTMVNLYWYGTGTKHPIGKVYCRSCDIIRKGYNCK